MNLALILLLSIFVEGAPLSDQSETVSWSESLNSRGTLAIIFSCFAALGFCVWSGIHLNAEFQTRSDTIRYTEKIIWAILALLAPDFIISIALHQRLVAEEYRRGVNASINGTQNDLTIQERKHT